MRNGVRVVSCSLHFLRAVNVGGKDSVIVQVVEFALPIPGLEYSREVQKWDCLL